MKKGIQKREHDMHSIVQFCVLIVFIVSLMFGVRFMSASLFLLSEF